MKLNFKKLENKVRFIRCVVNYEIVVNNRKRADLFLELREKNFDPFPKKKKAEPAAVGATEEDEENEESPEATNGVDPSDYEYLIAMPIGTLTLEKMQELNAEREKLVIEVEELENTTPKSLWLKDLDTFDKDLDVSNAILLCSVYSFLFSALLAHSTTLMQVLDQKDLAEEEERRIKREKNANKKEGSKAGPKKQGKKAAVKLPKVESDTEGILLFLHCTTVFMSCSCGMCWLRLYFEPMLKLCLPITGDGVEPVVAKRGAQRKKPAKKVRT